MPVKWDDAARLTVSRSNLPLFRHLLTSISSCEPQLLIALPSNSMPRKLPSIGVRIFYLTSSSRTVSNSTAAVDHDEDKPSARSVGDNFRNIMKHAEDLEKLRQVKQERSTKKEEEVEVKLEQRDTATTTPKAATKLEPITPIGRSGVKSTKSAVKKSDSDFKRKRRGESTSSSTERVSDSETSSGSDTEVVSPTPNPTRTMPLRKSRRVAPVVTEDSDRDVDAGAKDHGSGGSDEEYDLVEERRKKAARKSKEAKMAARRARK